MPGRYSSKDGIGKKLMYLGREIWVLELRATEIVLNIKNHY